MISILIPVLNDTDNLFKTLNSIEKSTIGEVETIIIDSSEIPILFPKKYKNVNIIRQKENIGPAQSRHLAAKQSKYDILFMADSHTFFPIGWDKILINSFKDNKNQISAFPVTLSKTWDEKYFKYFPTYFGSDIYIKDAFSNDNFFDSHIRYEYVNNINAIKLAAYGINKEYFFSLRGFSDIRQWGSDELCLTIKVLCSGGKINLLNDKKFIHVNNKNSFTRNLAYIYYNKLRIARTFMDEASYQYLLNVVPNNQFTLKAREFITQDKDEISEYKNFYKSIFKKDFKQLRQEFNITE